MRSVIHEPARRRLAALALATLVMLVCGCSTLGIATKDDLTEADTRWKTDSRETSQRISQLDERTKDSQASLAELSASLDSLNAQYAQAADWIRELDLDDISRKAGEASQAASAIQEQNRAFMTTYLEWLKAQQALLAEQVSMIEGKMGPAAGATPPEEDAAEPE